MRHIWIYKMIDRASRWCATSWIMTKWWWLMRLCTWKWRVHVWLSSMILKRIILHNFKIKLKTFRWSKCLNRRNKTTISPISFRYQIPLKFPTRFRTIDFRVWTQKLSTKCQEALLNMMTTIKTKKVRITSMKMKSQFTKTKMPFIMPNWIILIYLQTVKIIIYKINNRSLYKIKKAKTKTSSGNK